MSWPIIRAASLSFACLAVGLSFAGSAAAKYGDPLQDAEARRAVAVQRAERDVRDLCDDALDQARTDPAKAAERLRTYILVVDSNADISASKRDDLKDRLKRAIKQVEVIAAAPRAVDPPIKPIRPDTRPEDHKNVVKGAGTAISSRADAIAAYNDIKQKREQNYVMVMMEVEKSALVPIGDIEFPRDWREKSMRRLQNTEMTATEKAIMKALGTVISVDFKENRFPGVMDWFQKQMGAPIITDKGALDDVGVTNESVVNLHLEKVSTRTALKKVLADLQLTYVIDKETILITTPAKAKEMLSTRTYSVADLAPVTDIRLGDLGKLAAAQTVMDLVNFIQNNIDKDSWEANGGNNRILFNPLNMTITVTAPTEMHLRMHGYGF